MLASMLRGSTILGCTKIRDWALKRLHTEWDVDSYFQLLGTGSDRPRPRPMETILLARSLTGGIADDILKPASYELLRRGDLGLGTSVQEPKSAKKSLESEGERTRGERHATEESPNLPLSDFQRLLQTRAKLTEQWISNVLISSSACNAPMEASTEVFDGRAGSEATSRTQGDANNEPPPRVMLTCGANLRLRWSQLIHESRIFEDYLYDPISGFQQLIQASEKWGKDVCCGSCLQVHRDDWKCAREKIWKYLDTWMELPTPQGGAFRRLG